jgi:uncharacterized protein GlcG (DUF336 family)
MTRHFTIAALSAVLLAATAPSALALEALTADDVAGVIARVVNEAKAEHHPATIAVVDRTGAVLAVYQMAGAPTAFEVVSDGVGDPNQINGDATSPDFLNGDTLTGYLRTLPNGVIPNSALFMAVSKAITGAYLSTSQGNAFSTRTASQIVQDHFDPGTKNAPSGPLYGVQFSSLPCSDYTVRLDASDPSTLTRGPHRTPLGLAADPGGFPLYKNNQLVGGVGVKAVGVYGDDKNITDVVKLPDELLAVAGTFGMTPTNHLLAENDQSARPVGQNNTNITVGGQTLRYSDVSTGDLVADPSKAPSFYSLTSATGQLVSVPGFYNASSGLRAGSAYGTPQSGIMQDNSGTFNTQTPPYFLVNGAGALRFPPTAGSGPAALTAAEVKVILQSAYNVILQTRAQIRVAPNAVTEPHAAVTVNVVDIYGTVLGEVSSPDEPFFGIDVSLQKARTAAFLSNPFAHTALQNSGINLSTGTGIIPQLPGGINRASIARFDTAANAAFGRTIFASGLAFSEVAVGNIARDTLPDGIDGSPHGPLALDAQLTSPFSDGLQLDLIIDDLALAALGPQGALPTYLPTDAPPYCTFLPAQPGSPTGKPALANGLQIFAGGFPIYRGNTLVGGIGISGDGIQQDALIGFLGVYNAGQQLKTGIGEAPAAIRIDRYQADGVTPIYVNCPVRPFINSDVQDPCNGK